MLPADDGESLPLLYHLNSEPRLTAIDPAAAVYEPSYKALAGAAGSVPLPPPVSDSPVARVIRARRSCRAFARRDLPLRLLAELLAGAYAVTGLDDLAGGLAGLGRTAPSAGALYPLEVYVALQRIPGLRAGLYHYHVLHHRLEPMRSGNAMPELADCLLQQRCLVEANALVIFSAVFRRTLAKYGPRGYRYILIEAGHAAQNLCLLAAEAGLGSLPLGGFFDTRLNRLLGLDGRTEAALYCVAVGHPASAP